MMALPSLNVTGCKDESEEDSEIMAKSPYLFLQVEKLQPAREFSDSRLHKYHLEPGKMQSPGTPR